MNQKKNVKNLIKFCPIYGLFLSDCESSGPPSTEMEGGQHVIRNERDRTVYNYFLFHVTMCLANMYTTMQLTQWFQPQVKISL